MCGIVGFAGPNSFGYGDLRRICEQMTQLLYNRGPDDGGVWIDPNSKLGLGHRRLAILDLSLAGHQPMESRSNRYVIAYNGEIYNHIELRNSMDDCRPWLGQSDTETLLACFERYGITKTLEKLCGMFALAVWDKSEEKLYLARDRMGEKPLYFGWQGSGFQRAFIFASDLSALKAHPSFDNKLNKNALSNLIHKNYIGNNSIYEGINKLDPGSVLCFDRKSSACTTTKFWDAKWFTGQPKQSGALKSYKNYVAELERKILDSVKKQMISDVPLGAFLSGGIDSSLIVSLMQSISSNPIKTFTIGFDDHSYNEANHAKLIANHLKTEHTELYIDGKQAMDTIINLPNVYTEPLADSSQIPTVLLCEMTSKEVSVSLSGDGGDELFFGYSRYYQCRNAWALKQYVPNLLVDRCADFFQTVDAENYDKILSFLFKGKRHIGDKIKKIASLSKATSIETLYDTYVSNFDANINFMTGMHVKSTRTDDVFSLDPLSAMSLYDIKNYLPNDILVKLDRAAMYYSLESRCPLLSHDIVEYALLAPNNYKHRHGQSKAPLRDIVQKYIPSELIDRPKMGFGVPIGKWINGPLLPWVEENLNPERIKAEGIFNPEFISRFWKEHRDGTRNWQSVLWAVLSFQQWNSKNKVLN